MSGVAVEHSQFLHFLHFLSEETGYCTLIMLGHEHEEYRLGLQADKCNFLHDHLCQYQQCKGKMWKGVCIVMYTYMYI